jgi:hypothetical protein
VAVCQVPRNTLDVDCLIAMENDPLMADELTKAGFECFEEKSSFRRFRHRLQPFLILDVMRVKAATFEKMWAACEDYGRTGFRCGFPLWRIFWR